jgi:chorismate synthase
MLRYWTAGESHGKTLLALVDGFPAGVTIDPAPIDHELRRRQGGYGRGGRQRIETDTVEFLTGVWKNVTLGSPVALQVVNRDYKLERLDDLSRPRPGHGDLTGAWDRSAASWNGPARGKQRFAWRPARSRSNCWPSSASARSAMWWSSAA